MTPDHVRGRLSNDAGATSSSIISPTTPSPIPTLSNAPSLTLSSASTTSGKPIHRPFSYGLLRGSYRLQKRRRSMLRWFLRRQIAVFERTWDYDTSYLRGADRCRSEGDA